MKNNFAILVLSCDKYSSLWEPFFIQFDRHWKDCPYKIYLGSNSKNYLRKRLINVNSVINRDWSSNLLRILEQIPEEYLFIWLEDYFLVAKMDGKKFDAAKRFFIEHKGNHMHMTSSVPSEPIKGSLQYGFVEKGAPYRLAAYGFWNKSHLVKMLIQGENVWQFEVFGSYRSSFYDGYFNVKKDLFHYVQIVARGKIFRESYEYCMKHGIHLDISDWEIHSRLTTLKNNLFRFFFVIIIRIPWKFRVYCMDICRKVFAAY